MWYRLRWWVEETLKRRKEESSLRRLDIKYYLERKKLGQQLGKASSIDEQIEAGWTERDFTESYFRKRLPIERSLVERELRKWHIHEMRSHLGQSLSVSDIDKAWRLIAKARRDNRQVWIVTILAAISALDATLNAHSGLIQLAHFLSGMAKGVLSFATHLLAHLVSAIHSPGSP